MTRPWPGASRTRPSWPPPRPTSARSQGLIKKGFVSKQDLETQRNTVQPARGGGGRRQGQHRVAKVNLDYTDVTAPIDGLAGIRQVDPGNVLSTSDTIVVLTQVHPINVLFTLPEQDLDRVRRAQAPRARCR